MPSLYVKKLAKIIFKYFLKGKTVVFGSKSFSRENGHLLFYIDVRNANGRYHLFKKVTSTFLNEKVIVLILKSDMITKVLE